MQCVFLLDIAQTPPPMIVPFLRDAFLYSAHRNSFSTRQLDANNNWIQIAGKSRPNERRKKTNTNYSCGTAEILQQVGGVIYFQWSHGKDITATMRQQPSKFRWYTEKCTTNNEILNKWCHFFIQYTDLSTQLIWLYQCNSGRQMLPKCMQCATFLIDNVYHLRHFKVNFQLNSFLATNSVPNFEFQSENVAWMAQFLHSSQ